MISSFDFLTLYFFIIGLFVLCASIYSLADLISGV